MFNMLEKLINEHGSSTILKERLGLREDQISLLKKEYGTLLSENETLKQENHELKDQIIQLQTNDNSFSHDTKKKEELAQTAKLLANESIIVPAEIDQVSSDYSKDLFSIFINIQNSWLLVYPTE